MTSLLTDALARSWARVSSRGTTHQASGPEGSAGEGQRGEADLRGQGWQSTPVAAVLDGDDGGLRKYIGSCRRTYYRVATHLPLRLAWLTSEGADLLRHEIELPFGRPDECADTSVNARLQRIEDKLDLLLRVDAPAYVAPLSTADSASLVLSGSGLETRTVEPFRPGDAVRVDLLLPGEEPQLVTALAHVVLGPPRRNSGQPSRLALSFSMIDEGGRDAIVRHSCEIQRRALRDRTESKATS